MITLIGKQYFIAVPRMKNNNNRSSWAIGTKYWSANVTGICS